MLRYTVGRVPVERTFALRKAVLRPHLSPNEEFSLPDDHFPTTVAFAAETDDGSVVSCARLTPEPPPFALDELAGGEAGDQVAGSGEAARAGGGEDAGVGGGEGWRLRNMATDPAVRNRGVGAAVLGAAIDYVASQGGGILWCNARIAAQGLYARAGMETYGEIWEEPDIGPHIVMWRRVLGRATA